MIATILLALALGRRVAGIEALVESTGDVRPETAFRFSKERRSIKTDSPRLTTEKRIWVDIGKPSLLRGEAACYDDVYVVMLNPVIEASTNSRYVSGPVENDRGVLLPLAARPGVAERARHR